MPRRVYAPPKPGARPSGRDHGAPLGQEWREFRHKRASSLVYASLAGSPPFIHFPISQTVNDTIALHSSPMRRLADLGADALTQIDALTLLLDASDSTLAGEILAKYGSLTGLARASLANLRRFLPQTKAARLVAALRLGTLACKDTLTKEHFDNPESVYNAFGPEMGCVATL